MASLFLDTSQKVTFGILDEDYQWLRFHISEDTKASKVLHLLIHEALEELGFELSALNEIFYLTGPGSYTGVRVAQGFVEILEWQGFEAYSCRHFDIPLILGRKRGAFVSKAFKQEAFLYEWDGESHKQKLMPEELARERISNLAGEGVACFSSEQDFYKECLSTYDLIENQPSTLFANMKKRKMKSDVFYYRNLEEEFTKGK